MSSTAGGVLSTSKFEITGPEDQGGGDGKTKFEVAVRRESIFEYTLNSLDYCFLFIRPFLLFFSLTTNTPILPHIRIHSQPAVQQLVMLSSEEYTEDPHDTLQKFESRDHPRLARLPTHLCPDTNMRYILWSDIQDTFPNVSYLQTYVGRAMFMIDRHGEL